jgi:DNA-binding NarL/FixJ family response regulator
MSKKIRAIIVDDHDIFRQGVTELLGKSDKIEMIGEARNGKEFTNLIETLKPDVVLMDIEMPIMDGIEATRLAVQKYPNIKILALSMFGGEDNYYKMIQSGAHGFVLKSEGINNLEEAIQKIAKGSSYFSKELLNIIRRNMTEESPTEISKGFSSKETAVLKCIANNLSDKEIADEIKENTEAVNNMLHNLLKKTGSVNTSGLILFAIRNKIIPL